MAKGLMTVCKDEADGWEVEKKPRIAQEAEAAAFATGDFTLLFQYFMDFLLYFQCFIRQSFNEICFCIY